MFQTTFGLDAREPREASKVQGLDGNVEMGQQCKDYPFLISSVIRCK